MLLSLADINDWKALKLGYFEKSNEEYDLKEALDEIKTLVQFYIKYNKHKSQFIFEPVFENLFPNSG